MNEKSLPLVSRVIFSIAAAGLVLFILYRNIEPFGITLLYSTTSNDKELISDLSPLNRVEKVLENGVSATKQIDDLVYFSTKHPSRIETATVKVKFKNPNPDQVLELGFADRDSWHYDRKIIDAPIFNNLGWSVVGQDPVLWQRDAKYSSVEEFLANPPADSLIGLYKYDKDLLTSLTKLPDYKPANTDTVIDIPLRGRHTLYAYVEGERFRMNFTKQDLNWYEDPDVVNVRIYKEKDLVYETDIDDDGVEDASRKAMPPVEALVENPGPQLPEPGVYKIVIEANADVIIKKITTNLHKIVFEGPIFLAGNKDVYTTVISETRPTNLVTDAIALTAITYHNEGMQTIDVAQKPLRIAYINNEITHIPKGNFNAIKIPINDVVLNGIAGYFALTSDAFFVPSIRKIVPLTSREEIDYVDYILTGYQPSTQEGDWRVAKLNFDFTTSYPKNGRLSWLFMAPQLKENGRSVVIGDIEVELYKKPIIPL